MNFVSLPRFPHQLGLSYRPAIMRFLLGQLLIARHDFRSEVYLPRAYCAQFEPYLQDSDIELVQFDKPLYGEVAYSKAIYHLAGEQKHPFLFMDERILMWDRLEPAAPVGTVRYLHYNPETAQLYTICELLKNRPSKLIDPVFDSSVMDHEMQVDCSLFGGDSRPFFRDFSRYLEAALDDVSDFTSLQIRKICTYLYGGFARKNGMNTRPILEKAPDIFFYQNYFWLLLERPHDPISFVTDEELALPGNCQHLQLILKREFADRYEMMDEDGLFDFVDLAVRWDGGTMDDYCRTIEYLALSDEQETILRDLPRSVLESGDPRLRDIYEYERVAKDYGKTRGEQSLEALDVELSIAVQQLSRRRPELLRCTLKVSPAVKIHSSRWKWDSRWPEEIPVALLARLKAQYNLEEDPGYFETAFRNLADDGHYSSVAERSLSPMEIVILDGIKQGMSLGVVIEECAKYYPVQDASAFEEIVMGHVRNLWYEGILTAG